MKKKISFGILIMRTFTLILYYNKQPIQRNLLFQSQKEKEKMLEICKKGMKERTRNPVSEEKAE